MNKLKDKIRGLRWRLADWLSFLACKLRGHRWIDINCYGIGGNRAAELKQRLWEDCVLLDSKLGGTEGWLNDAERDLAELAELAGENWGHIAPRSEPQPKPKTPHYPDNWTRQRQRHNP